MELAEVFKDIKNNTLKPLYIFVGEETAVMSRYISAVKLPKVEAMSVSDVIRMCSSSKLFASDPKLYKVFDVNGEYLQQEKSWVNLRNLLGANTLILEYVKLDKRSKFYKFFQNDIIEFNRLDSNILRKHIQKDIDLTYDNIERLIDITNGNYNLILMEIDKITNFAQANGMEDNDAFIYLYENNCLSVIHSDVVLELKDAYLKRDTSRILKLSEIFKQQSESVIYLLALLYNAFKQQLLVEATLLSGKKENLPFNAWQLKKSQEVAGYYTLKELRDNMEIVRTYEMGIKQGIFDVESALDFLYIAIIGGMGV